MNPRRVPIESVNVVFHQPAADAPMNFDSNSLIASLIWGSIGSGFVIYGKKQGEPVPLFGGLALVGISYFIESALIMSLVGAALVAGIFWLRRRF